jgi:hypothetical protein
MRSHCCVGVCVCIPPIVARQRLGRSGNEYTRNNRIIVGRVFFNVARVVPRKVGDLFCPELLIFLRVAPTAQSSLIRLLSHSLAMSGLVCFTFTSGRSFILLGLSCLVGVQGMDKFGGQLEAAIFYDHQHANVFVLFLHC